MSVAGAPRFTLNTLALKLTLAFALVGVIGVVLFALLVGLRSHTELTRFLSDRDQAVLVNTLERYYAANGGWQGLAEFVANSPALRLMTRNLVVTDAAGDVVLGSRPARNRMGMPHEMGEPTPLVVNGQTVGYVRVTMRPMMIPMMIMDDDARPFPLESDLFARIAWAAAASAGVTLLVALVVGGLLARTLTRPLRELTAATQAMAGGKLDQQVNVRSADEIGELATSFNRMSADLARASQLRKQMTADLAHDLRTPLSIVRGYMEGLQEGRLQGTPELYNLLYAEVEHLQRLVEDLRVLSLADAGELSLNRRRVDPRALLERTALAYFVAAENQGITLRVEAADALPSIRVDTDRMTQVLNNLVTNALRHTLRGEIALGATTAADTVTLTVRDSGEGIAPEDLPFVFDRFYRADKARVRRDQADDGASSGLGLAIAKALVESHGGTLTVASTLGMGATFAITLPVDGETEK